MTQLNTVIASTYGNFCPKTPDMSACASQATEKSVKYVYGKVSQLPRSGRSRETYINKR